MDFAPLETLYADFYRGANDMQRIAEMAGLDVTLLAVHGAPVVSWYNLLTLAEQEGRMSDLYAVVRKEHPRNTDLPAAWTAYQESAQPPAHSVHKGPPRGQAGERLSDYRNDERRDARVDQMQRDIADMRVQIAGLVVQVSALTEMMRKQSEQETPSLSNAQFAAVMAAFAAIAVIVFAAVYYGGNR